MNLRNRTLAYLAPAALAVAARIALDLYPVDHPVAQAPMLGWPALLLVLALGYPALLLAEREGCAPAWAGRGAAAPRLLAPALLGLAFAGVEIGVSLLRDFPNFHAPFPGSIPTYLAFGTVYEIRYHLLPLGVGLWVAGRLLLRGRRSGLVFWAAALAISLREPLGQIGGLRAMGLIEGPFWTVFFFAFVFAANLVPLYLFRRHGLFALLVFRLANYALWHVAWPAVVFPAG